MRLLMGLALTAGVACAGPVKAVFSFTVDGAAGPIAVEAKAVRSHGGHAVVSMTAHNNTGIQFRHVSFCVDLTGNLAECGAVFWTAGLWAPGKELNWVSAPVPDKPFKGLKITLRRADRDPYAKIRRIWVAPLEGTNGELAREQLIASVINSRRFVVVEAQDKADAVIRGRAELATRSSVAKAESQEPETVQRAAPRSVETVEMTKPEALILRLITKDGDNLWAWDDSAPCAGFNNRARCAIDSLRQSTVAPTTKDGN